MLPAVPALFSAVCDSVCGARHGGQLRLPAGVIHLKAAAALLHWYPLHTAHAARVCATLR